jgi:hypothetical protein
VIKSSEIHCGFTPPRAFFNDLRTNAAPRRILYKQRFSRQRNFQRNRALFPTTSGRFPATASPNSYDIPPYQSGSEPLARRTDADHKLSPRMDF